MKVNINGGVQTVVLSVCEHFCCGACCCGCFYFFEKVFGSLPLIGNVVVSIVFGQYHYDIIDPQVDLSME